ncbi:MAG: FG-GAP repeat domain-containing protein [Hyphomicrobiales bacterium]
MRVWAGVAFLALALLAADVQAEPKQVVVQLPAAPVSIWTDGKSLGVRLKNGRIAGFTAKGKSAKPPKQLQEKVPAGGLPDGVLVRGSSDIRKAWLTGPTRRYGHAVLGDGIEAGGLAVKTAKGKFLEYVLPKSEVFEDRFARIADLDGDGASEIIAVNSHADFGAALSVFGVRNGKLSLFSRTPFIGTSNRWLNPAGIADFDGDGRKEVAIVVTPHIGGTLQFWELRGGKLKLQAEKYGFSNHFIGSRIQDISEFAGGSNPVLVLPGADRKTLLGVSLRGKTVRVDWQIALGGKVMTEIVSFRSQEKSPAIAAGLSDNSLLILN